MEPHLLSTALLQLGHACPAACSCAKDYYGPRSNASATSSQLTVAQYLTRVYPAAAKRFATMSPVEARQFFESLHFFYDHGVLGCNEPGAVLRYLYPELLPCVDLPGRRTPRGSRPSARVCVEAHYKFSPAWASEVAANGWAEVEHRAVGFAVKSVTDIIGLSGTGIPQSATAFMDAGAAGMWYTYRRGSGIFYRMGRTKIAPGKTAMMAELLDELARVPNNQHASTWVAFAKRSGLFAPAAPSLGPRGDAGRIRAVANGSAHCATNGVGFCRCQCILHDVWDDAMVWEARLLQYETLFFTATLLCHQDHNSTFTTAYPEIADVRPLDESWADEQGRGTYSMLVQRPAATAAGPKDPPGEVLGQTIHTLRKQPLAAERWLTMVRQSGVLSLRDPIVPAAATLARPCNFSVARWSLQCEGHISSRWPTSEWHSCALPMCGSRGLWVGGGRVALGRQTPRSPIATSVPIGAAATAGPIGATEVSARPSLSAAICISGLERTLLAPPVYSTFHEHVVLPLRRNVGPTVDSYITVINETFPREWDLRQRIHEAYSTMQIQLLGSQPLPNFRCALHGSHLAGPNGSIPYLGTEKRAVRHARAIMLQWVGIRACYEQLVSGEQTRGARYSLIFRTRSDVVYLRDIPITVDVLSRQEVYVPEGGMTEKPEFQCMNDHMFLCPRALCRPYFHLLELWESEQCVEQPDTPGKTVTATRSIFASTRADGSLVLQDPWRAPSSKFLLPTPPPKANAEWFFLARYSTGGRLCAEGESAPQCCGMLRELRWPYAISRGTAGMGYIECHQRVLKFWRGDQKLLAVEHREALIKCEALAANWTQWQRERAAELAARSSSKPAGEVAQQTAAIRPLSRREVRSAG